MLLGIIISSVAGLVTSFIALDLYEPYKIRRRRIIDFFASRIARWRERRVAELKRKKANLLAISGSGIAQYAVSVVTFFSAIKLFMTALLFTMLSIIAFILTTFFEVQAGQKVPHLNQIHGVFERFLISNYLPEILLIFSSIIGVILLFLAMSALSHSDRTFSEGFDCFSPDAAVKTLNMRLEKIRKGASTEDVPKPPDNDASA